jgi:hypothetical protein
MIIDDLVSVKRRPFTTRFSTMSYSFNHQRDDPEEKHMEPHGTNTIAKSSFKPIRGCVLSAKYASRFTSHAHGILNVNHL